MKRSYEKAFLIKEGPCSEEGPRSESPRSERRIVLNVGGTLFETMEHTLRNSIYFFPQSLLGVMFRPEHGCGREGEIFLDADPVYFRAILNVLRYPLLIDEVPPKMSIGVWSQQLEYWGLADRVDLDENAKRVKPLGEMSMKEISEKMKRDTMKDEEIVIKTILESTGYYERGGKSRKTVLHVPIGCCKLPWGSDLGETLKHDSPHYEELLRSQLKVTDVSIKDSHKKTLTYVFMGETYSITETKTITISFIVVL